MPSRDRWTADGKSAKHVRAGRKGGKAPKKSPAGFAYIKIHDPERFKEMVRKGGYNRHHKPQPTEDES